MLPAADTARDAGMVTWAAVFGIAYLSSVIATSLLSELAIAAALLASGTCS